MGGVLTSSVAFGLAGGGADGDAGVFAHDVEGHTNAGAVAAAGVARGGGVLAGQQVDLVVCGQAGGVTGADGGAFVCYGFNNCLSSIYKGEWLFR